MSISFITHISYVIHSNKLNYSVMKKSRKMEESSSFIYVHYNYINKICIEATYIIQMQINETLVTNLIT